MSKYIVTGGTPLNGRVKISGMKNAAGAVIFGCLVSGGEYTIDNVPDIGDVSVAIELLRSVGAVAEWIAPDKLRINTENVTDVRPPDELVGKIRSSYYMAGAMLARFGHVGIGMPGGCDFGSRPIDQHIKAFEQLGAVVTFGENGLAADGRLTGTEIYFDCVTVGGTMNAMLAACTADGMTVIANAAREPHVVDLANFLNTCGARISGAGTNVIKIRGVPSLHGAEYRILPDMIEAGMYMVAAAATGGCICVESVIPKHLEAVTAKLTEMGATVDELDDAIIVSGDKQLKATKIKTQPYPGFPTDMQPLMAVLMSISRGTGTIQETIYDNRFRYSEELRRMGANVRVNGKSAEITGVPSLHGASVRAVDLRAGAAMIVAALSAEGQTEIDDIYHIERGYVMPVEKFTSLGADIRRIG